jgi:hypothetical protein
VLPTWTGRAVLVPVDVAELSGRDGAVGTGAGGAGEGAATEDSSPGTIFSVALAQLALYPSRVFAAVGLMAKTMPDWQWSAWAQ